MQKLLMFVGTDCPHCDVMRPLVAKLSFETGIEIQERDIWKSERDARLLENYRGEVTKKDPECDGIPFFYNVQTGDYLCGEVSYQKLKKWVTKN
jgi:thiol-disulfide isomerase/thioredoxin